MSPDQIDQAKACKTPEELVQYMRGEGVELSDEQLAQISGGGWTGHQCPQCGSYDVEAIVGPGLICNACGHRSA